MHFADCYTLLSPKFSVPMIQLQSDVLLKPFRQQPHPHLDCYQVPWRMRRSPHSWYSGGRSLKPEFTEPVHFSISLYLSTPQYLCTSVYLYIPLCTSLYLSVPLCTSLYLCIPLCTSVSLSVPGCTWWSSLHLPLAR